MLRFFAGLVLALTASEGLRPPLASAAEPLRTTAEKSDYQATSRYADVVAFCDELAKRSPTVKSTTL